jgi:F-type H+-transporting ATPase subunit a
MNELENLGKIVYWHLTLGKLDLSITSLVISLWLATAAVFMFFFLVSRRLKQVPGKLQGVAEVMVLFLRDEVAGQIKDNRSAWLPFIIALFFFVLANNLIGLIPGLAPATSNVNVTATLAVMVFLIVQIAGIKKNGLKGYCKSFLPEGIPIIIAVLMLPVEIISQLAKPFSLTIRLFANIFAGHAVIFTLISLIFLFKNYFIIPLPLLGNVCILAFEIFVAFIQAFIFTYLSSMYIASALEGH